jgi:N4-gp56 family major capsid protein
MAMTEYGVNAPEAVKLWSRKLAREALKQTYIQKFVGTSDDSLIQEKTDTKKGPGDRITMTLRMQLSGDGVQGDATLEGNEEALTTYTDNIVINQLRHAVRSKGKMSEQRIPFSVREEAMKGLRDWWADRMDTGFFNQICGYTVQSDTKFTGNNSVVAPSSGRITRPAAVSADESLDTYATHKMTLDMIDRAVEAAETASPLIRPIMINGERHYVMFIHTYQATDLRLNSSTGQWQDIQKAAMQGGQTSKNPIFTGALGMYNNVILHKSTRVTQGVHSSTGAAVASVRRAVLCGAQACGIAHGQGHSLQQYDWTEEVFDYGNQLGVSAGCIAGLKKTVYNSVDFGTIVVPTYATATHA